MLKGLSLAGALQIHKMQNLCGEEEKLSNNIYKEHFEFSSGDAVLPPGSFFADSGYPVSLEPHVQGLAVSWLSLLH